MAINQNTNENWKATGFVNLSVKTASGSMSLPSIPLKDSNVNQAKLIEWLRGDTDGSRAAKFVANLTAVYRDAEPQVAEFDFMDDASENKAA